MDDPVEDDLRRRVDALVAAHQEPEGAAGIPFRQAQFDTGLAWVHHPVGRGGLGVPHSYHIVDMRDPGIDVRPLRMATGKADFNEVFMTNVRVPDDHRVGEPGRGWAVVTANLQEERAAFGLGAVTEDPGLPLLASYRRDRHSDAERDRMMRSYLRSWAARLTTLRSQQGAEAAPGWLHPAVVKILSTEAASARTEVMLDLLGPEGTGYADDGYAFEQPTTAGMRGDLREHFIRARAGTIEGGTSEVLRNVLGERVLGLPREVRSDLGVPWRAVPRS